MQVIQASNQHHRLILRPKHSIWVYGTQDKGEMANSWPKWIIKQHFPGSQIARSRTHTSCDGGITIAEMLVAIIVSLLHYTTAET